MKYNPINNIFINYILFQSVNEAVMKEYLQRVYKSIINNVELQMLGDGIPKLLINQAQCIVLMHR